MENNSPELGLNFEQEHPNYAIADEERIRKQYGIMPSVTLIAQGNGKFLVQTAAGQMPVEEWVAMQKELDDHPGDIYQPYKKAS